MDARGLHDTRTRTRCPQRVTAPSRRRCIDAWDRAYARYKAHVTPRHGHAGARKLAAPQPAGAQALGAAAGGPGSTTPKRPGGAGGAGAGAGGKGGGKLGVVNKWQVCGLSGGQGKTA